MILSNKTLDTVIAVSGAMQDMAADGSMFKANLERLVVNKAALDSAIKDYKARQKKITASLKKVNDKTADLEAAEQTASQAISRAEKKASVNKAEKDALSVLRKELDEKTEFLANLNAELVKTRDDLTERQVKMDSIFAERDANLKIKEDKVERVLQAME